MQGLASNETGTLAQVQETAQMRTKPYVAGKSEIKTGVSL